MKIIHILSSLKKTHGGTTFFVSDLINELVKKKVDVSLISQISKNKGFSYNDLYLPSEKKASIELIECENGLFNQIFVPRFQKNLHNIYLIKIQN